jgi:hypothetical protein
MDWPDNELAPLWREPDVVTALELIFEVRARCVFVLLDLHFKHCLYLSSNG